MPCVGEVGYAVPGAAGEGEDGYQPAARVEFLALDECVDDHAAGNRLARQKECGEECVCDPELCLGELGQNKAGGAIEGACRKCCPCTDLEETHKPQGVVELEQIDEEIPLGDLAELDRDLDEESEPDSVDMQMEAVEDELDERHKTEGRDPQQEPLATVAEPGDEAEERRQHIKRREAEAKLGVLQPAEIARVFELGNCGWAADHRSGAETASGAIVRRRRGWSL